MSMEYVKQLWNNDDGQSLLSRVTDRRVTSSRDLPPTGCTTRFRSTQFTQRGLFVLDSKGLNYA